jgi:pilus assembly protein Flp/PilA
MQFFKDESGASLVEYGLLIALIGVTAIGAISLLGDSIAGIFSSIAERLNTLNQEVSNS